jgi:hypothetical protein
VGILGYKSMQTLRQYFLPNSNFGDPFSPIQELNLAPFPTCLFFGICWLCPEGEISSEEVGSLAYRNLEELP